MEWKFTARQIRNLERRLAEVQDAREYRRVLAVLEVARGATVTDAARLLNVSRQSIYNWLQESFASEQPGVLRDAERTGRPSLWTGPVLETLAQALDQSPDAWGYQAGSWTAPLLQRHVEIQTGIRPSDSSLRRQLDALGFVWERTRYVLAPDPEREKKTRNPSENSPIAWAERRAVRR